MQELEAVCSYFNTQDAFMFGWIRENVLFEYTKGPHVRNAAKWQKLALLGMGMSDLSLLSPNICVHRIQICILEILQV